MADTDPFAFGNSGAFASNVNVGRDFVQNVHQYFRDIIRKQLLDPHHVTELLRAYEPPAARDRAAEVLGHHHAVALVGGEGTGRRTTAVQLLHERNVTLHELVPEFGQDLTAPPCEPGCGYLYAPETLDAAAVEDYTARLRAMDSYLVVWTTQDVTQHHGTFLAEIGIELDTPVPEGVFRRILDARLRPAEAAWWRTCPDLEPVVKDARPADVARLVDFVRRAMAIHGCTDAAAAAVIDAYRNWDDYLQAKFGNAAFDLRDRTRLIAVAMVDGGPETAVHEAAIALGEKLGVPAEEGHGLAGAGIRSLHKGTEASCDGGMVRLLKPAFAESVLDYVARTYPQVWAHVREWMVELPQQLRFEPRNPSLHARLAHTVVKLAIRRNELDLVRRATEDWSAASGTRPLAVEVLTIAALDAGLGRWVRQWMYDGAYYRRCAASTLIAIAEACAQYGTVYPDNAMTRLRHLAAAGDETVRSAVRQAVTELAQDNRIRTRILANLGAWVQRAKGRAVGCEAFLDIMESRDDKNRIEAIGEAARYRAYGLTLSRGWRGALVEPATTDRARTLIAAWLDDALTHGQPGNADRPRVVVRILGQAAGEDARYLPRLTRAVDVWYAQADRTPARTALRRTLIDTASSVDPLLSAQEGEGAA